MKGKKGKKMDVDGKEKNNFQATIPEDLKRDFHAAAIKNKTNMTEATIELMKRYIKRGGLD